MWGKIILTFLMHFWDHHSIHYHGTFAQVKTQAWINNHWVKQKSIRAVCHSQTKVVPAGGTGLREGKISWCPKSQGRLWDESSCLFFLPLFPLFSGSPLFSLALNFLSSLLHLCLLLLSFIFPFLFFSCPSYFFCPSQFALFLHSTFVLIIGSILQWIWKPLIF